MKSKLRREIQLRTESGQALVEFVFVVPVLMLVIYGIFQFAGAYNHYINLTDGTRAGARKAAVSRTGAGGADPTTAIQNAVKSSAADLDAAQVAITITPACNWSSTTSTCMGWTPGGSVKITATYPYDINLFGKVVSSGNLSSSTSERVE
jgi:Flp pilus assembly protein TadG